MKGGASRKCIASGPRRAWVTRRDRLRQLAIGFGIFVFETAKELRSSPRLPLRQGPIDLTGWFAMITAGVGFHDAGINGEALTSN
jgi:hypothetical protein